MPTKIANGIELHYHLDGPDKGPVVLLANSLSSNLGMWEPQVPALVEAGFRVLRYDKRGHGRSQVPKGPYTMEQLAADAVCLLDVLKIRKAHFCGLSIGGMIGQQVGARHGDRLLSLTLCDTNSFVPNKQQWEDRFKAVRGGGMAAVVDTTIDRWFTKPGQARLPKVIADVRKMILSTPVEGFVGCGMAIRDMDNRPLLAQIKAPTLVIVGREDQGTPVEANQYIHEHIAGSTFTILENAAHICNMEQAEAFNASLLAHLKKHAKAA
jgi:3-oxoadipate enol-lactonase